MTTHRKNTLRDRIGRMDATARRRGGALLAIVALAAVSAAVLPGSGDRRVASVPDNRPRITTPTIAVGTGSTATAASVAAPVAATRTAASPEPAAKPRTDLIGFYVNWDPTSYASLEANIDKLTGVMPMWLHIGNDGRVTVDDPAQQAKVMALIRSRRPDLKVMPIVNNYDQASDRWNPKEFAALIKQPAQREAIAERIVDHLAANDFQGVNVDFENLTAASKGDLVAFQRVLYAKAKTRDLEVSQDVMVLGSAYDLKGLAEANDYLIPMMYDEHWKTSGPGAIASQAWYERLLERLLTQVPARKVVVGMGAWTYDWAATGGRAKSMTYPQALATAKAGKRSITLDPATLNPTFSYAEGGTNHRVWMLDAATTFNQAVAASRLEPRGYALWRLGAEDPATWRVLENRDELDAEVAKSLNGRSRAVTYDAKQGLITRERLIP